MFVVLNSVDQGDDQACWEDIGNTYLRVSTPDGTHELLDQRNACNGKPGNYVEGIDDVTNAMRALVPPTTP